MKKRRITLSLDEDVVEALEAINGRSLSATVNGALRKAVADDAHRAALTEWLDELDAAYGTVTPEKGRAVDQLVDEIFGWPPNSDEP